MGFLDGDVIWTPGTSLRAMDVVAIKQALIDIRTALGGIVSGFEPVHARASRNSAQVIPNNTATRLDFDDVDHETHPGMITTGATWKCTVPNSGYYLVNEMWTWLNTGIGNHIIEAVNTGVLLLILDRKDFGTAFGDSALTGSAVFRCAANAEIYSRAFQDTGVDQQNQTGSADNWIEITKISDLEA